MTIKELAQELGRSHQAVYKKVSRAGISLETLKSNGSSHLTEEGERIIRGLFDGGQHPPLEDEPSKDSPFNAVASEVESVASEVEQELNALRRELVESRHRVELAEMRAVAAEEERNFLRSQLDSAIKASALASVKRLSGDAIEQEQDPHRLPLIERIGVAIGIIKGNRTR